MPSQWISIILLRTLVFDFRYSESNPLDTSLCLDGGGEVGGENGVCVCYSLPGDVSRLVTEPLDCFDDYGVTY